MHPDHDPSIEHEPHLQPGGHEADSTEAEAERLLAAEAGRAGPDEVAEHTVWDEPALSAELTGPDRGGRLTYGDWLQWRMATTSATRTWVVTLLVVLAAGPWGLLGALFGGGGLWDVGAWGLVVVTIIGPVTEEITKISAALWVVEKRPYLFRTPVQILFCALAGGLAFAFIENLMYLHVYVPDATSRLALWRWTVCVGMHAVCSSLSGVGLVRMWSAAVGRRARPEIARAAPWIIAAIIGHGLYNGMVTIAELAGWLEFQ